MIDRIENLRKMADKLIELREALEESKSEIHQLWELVVDKE